MELSHARAVALVVDVWSELLDERVRPDDNFFLLGGSSIQALHAVAQLHRVSGRTLTLADLLAAPTPTGLGTRLLGADLDETAGRSVPDDPYPATFDQERRLLRDRSDLSRSFRLWHFVRCAAVDPGRFTNALAQVTERHDALHTRIFRDAAGNARQQVIPSDPRLELLHTTPEGLDGLIREFTEVDWAQAEGGGFRTRLVRVGGQWLILFGFDHAVFDGLSYQVFVRDLATAYRTGRLPARAAAAWWRYATWQRSTPLLAEDSDVRQWWRRHLAGSSPFKNPLPADPPAERQPGGPAAHVREWTVTGSQLAALREAARTAGATPFATVLAAVNLAAYQLTGDPDVVIASHTANRSRPEFAETVGSFATRIVFRTRFAPGATPAQVLAATTRAVRSTLRHADLPWSEVLRECAPANYLQTPNRIAWDLRVEDGDEVPAWDLDGAPCEPLPGLPGFVDPNVSVQLRIRPHRWRIRVSCASALYGERTADRVLDAIRSAQLAVAGEGTG
jgi:aryl carrier-like protein